jgi:hypothetical protein
MINYSILLIGKNSRGKDRVADLLQKHYNSEYAYKMCNTVEHLTEYIKKQNIAGTPCLVSTDIKIEDIPEDVLNLFVVEEITSEMFGAIPSETILDTETNVKVALSNETNKGLPTSRINDTINKIFYLLNGLDTNRAKSVLTRVHLNLDSSSVVKYQK